MSFKPIKTSLKNRKLDWINTIVHIHDLQCRLVKNLLQHTVKEIFAQEPSIKKCLTTGEDPITEEDAGFGPGDLEKLFAEDTTGEDDDPGATG